MAIHFYYSLEVRLGALTDFFGSFQVLKTPQKWHFNTSDGLFLGRFSDFSKNFVWLAIFCTFVGKFFSSRNALKNNLKMKVTLIQPLMSMRPMDTKLKTRRLRRYVMLSGSI